MLSTAHGNTRQAAYRPPLSIKKDVKKKLYFLSPGILLILWSLNSMYKEIRPKKETDNDDHCILCPDQKEQRLCNLFSQNGLINISSPDSCTSPELSYSSTTVSQGSSLSSDPKYKSESKRRDSQ